MIKSLIIALLVISCAQSSLPAHKWKPAPLVILRDHESDTIYIASGEKQEDFTLLIAIDKDGTVNANPGAYPELTRIWQVMWGHPNATPSTTIPSKELEFYCFEGRNCPDDWRNDQKRYRDGNHS